MSGIVNTTGAKSGVIGTIVGTPPSGTDIDADSWWLVLPADGVVSTDATIGADATWGWKVQNSKIGSNCSIASGIVTVGTAGWYIVNCNFGHSQQDDQTMDINLRISQTTGATPSNAGGYLGEASRMYADNTNDGIGYWKQSLSWFVELAATDKLDLFGRGKWYGTTTQEHTMSSWIGYRLGA